MFTKADLTEFRTCAKAFWLRRAKPDCAKWPTPGPFERMLARDGYEVERLASDWLSDNVPGEWHFQKTLSDGECLAKMDAVRINSDGSVALYEIKSSTDYREHLMEAAFQRIVAERARVVVASSHIVFVDKTYERRGDLDPDKFLTIANVDEEIERIRPAVEEDIAAALALLSKSAIDERGCDCRYKGKAQHCAAFAYLNPGVAPVSAHLLPRITAKRLIAMEGDGRFAIDGLCDKEVTMAQKPVLRALQTTRPQIDIDAVNRFIGKIEYPVLFYDYETFAHAIPQGEGHKPHEQLPVQFSCHVLQQNGDLAHHEFLCDAADAQEQLLHALLAVFEPLVQGSGGTAVVWNEGFEKSCNRRLARLLPAYASALDTINASTIDLMVPFKAMYVDPRFMGSTSIKRVLPVMALHLTYDGMAVGNGAQAITAFREMLAETDFDHRRNLRDALFDYCRLDSLAMVEIFRQLQDVVA